MARIVPITPSSSRIPMPGFDRQFGILAIRHRLPARGERWLERRRTQIFVDGRGGNAVDAGAQSFTGDEVVKRMRGVHGDDLGGGEESERRDDCDNGRRKFHARPPDVERRFKIAGVLKRLNYTDYVSGGRAVFDVWKMFVGGAPGVPAWPPQCRTLGLRSPQDRETPVSPPLQSSADFIPGFSGRTSYSGWRT